MEYAQLRWEPAAFDRDISQWLIPVKGSDLPFGACRVVRRTTGTFAGKYVLRAWDHPYATSPPLQPRPYGHVLDIAFIACLLTMLEEPP